MTRLTVWRLVLLLSLAVLAIAKPACTFARTQHFPTEAIIHPRGNTVTVEYFGSGLDLTIAAYWRVYSQSNTGLYAQPPSNVVADYLAKCVHITRGGHPLVGRLVFQRQKSPTTPDVSTFRAVVVYSDPTHAPPSGPLTFTSTLFSFDPHAIVQVSAYGKSFDAHVGVPVTFDASDVALTAPHVASDGFGAGIWASLDGGAVLLLILLLSPLPSLKAMALAWLRVAAGVIAGMLLACAAHASLNELTGRWILVGVVAIAAVVNFAGSGIARRDAVEVVLGLIAGAAFWFPLAELKIPDHLAALAVAAHIGGVLVGLAGIAAVAAVLLTLLSREAERRSRVDPKAPARAQFAVNIVALLAAAYWAFTL